MVSILIIGYLSKKSNPFFEKIEKIFFYYIIV